MYNRQPIICNLPHITNDYINEKSATIFNDALLNQD